MSQVTPEQAIQIALQHHRQGQLQQAETIYRQVLQQQPNNHDAMQLLGALAYQVGQMTAAAELIGKAIAIAPGKVHYHANLGMVLMKSGREREAEAALRRAIAIDAGHVEAHIHLGHLFMDEGKWTQSAEHFRTALRLKPDAAAVHNNLGHVLHSMGHAEQAAGAYADAIRCRPDFGEAHANLGGLLLEAGQVAEGLENMRKAIALQPNFPAVHGNLLYALHFDASMSPEAIFEEHLNWSRRNAEPLKGEIRPHANNRDPNRRLKIGYVSQDFRDHPVGRFILPILAAHDRGQVEVHVFSDVFFQDDLTALMRQHGDHWHNVHSKTDAAVANLVRELA
ncbi:MAG: tetratricopeptide repeat protein, partial [Tepidisphaeraceae bacterium]